MKVLAQANPHYSSRQVISQIVKERGLFGFSNTALANLPRRVLKESLRWPMISCTHELLVKQFPKTFTRETIYSKIATGVSVALFDTLIILPLDQLIAYRVKEQERYTAFFQKRFVQEGVSSLYQGVRVNLVRQIVMWTTVMTINHESKRLFDLIDKEQLHPFLRQGVTGVLIGSGFVAWGLPIDFVKTRIQMDPDLQKINASHVFKTLVHRHGFSGFYAGALPTFVHTVFHAALGGYILDKIFEKKAK
jgi:Mitochondrial carrier protein.